MNIQDLFALGMKRHIPELLDAPEGIVVNLGAGNSPIPGAVNLDWPEWSAESYGIRLLDEHGHLVIAEDESIACIHAYHFLEHLHDPLRMLMEINRVLKPGGVVNICVPHYSGSMAHQDLDHKRTFALETWDNALRCKYYTKDREGWKLRIHFNIMIAIAERNTCILAQLVKE